MYTSNCIFCKIINKEIPAAIVAENDSILVIQDRAPKAPVHNLIIPKQHVENIKTLQVDDAHITAQMMLMAKELSTRLSGSADFRLIMNNGAEAGQSVFHLHCHFLSGKKMLDF